MTTLTQVREENVTFDLTVNDDLPEFFVDGLSQFLLGAPISKLTFHSVTTPAGFGADVEQRKAVLKITIPTVVLLEFCRNVLFNAQSNVEQLTDGGLQMNNQIRHFMQGINIPPANK